MKEVVLIHGKAGAGKDTLCELLTNAITGRVRRIAFADPLKEGCSKIFGIPLEYFYDRELKEAADLADYGYPGKTPRWLLQVVGTEMFRDLFGKDIWIQTAANTINNDTEHDVFIVTDCRFTNEVDLGTRLKDARTYISMIERPNNPAPAFAHASEQDLPISLFDFKFLNDGSIKDLHEQVEASELVLRVREALAHQLKKDIDAAVFESEINNKRNRLNEEA